MIQGARPNNRQIVPYLFVRDGDAAIDYYRRAFGAVELYRSTMPGGLGMFAQLRIADSWIQVAEESPPDDRCPDHPLSPETLGGNSVIIEMYVDDVDAAFQRAVDEGGQPTMPPTDMFFGDRYSWVTDPFGHRWALATVKETLTAEQVKQRMEAFMAQISQQQEEGEPE
jgi:uncharacterized glyoxalase superfamily protein PhnB